MARQFHKTIITVTVLSEGPYVLNTLSAVAHDIVEGDCVGSYSVTTTEVLDGKDMALELLNNASDPEFFQLTEQGEEL